VPAMGRQLAAPFNPVALAHLDTFALTLTLCEGSGPWQQMERQASLVFCYEGRLTVDSELGEIVLEAGELTVVPVSLPHRLSSQRRALVLGLSRHKQPGLPLLD
jgi:mannose-6-phosphate isomerase-like protein (cupin superfamily)